MDENRYQAYLNLVQELLNHSPDQVPTILAEKPNLLDDGLIQTMKWVALNLKAKGEINTTNFLIYLVIQLTEILDFPSSSIPLSLTYLSYEIDFFFLSLPALQNSPGKSKIIYLQIQAVLSSSVLYFSEIESEQVLGLIALLEQFGSSVLNFPWGSRADNIEVAIMAYKSLVAATSR